MRRAAAPVALAFAVAVGVGASPAASQHGAGPAVAAQTPVSIGFDAVSPQHVDVLPGDTVRWSNDSVRTHTVTADDGGFDSGRLLSGDAYARAFVAIGDVPYHCTIHPFIRGDVGVRRLLLASPAAPAAPGRPFPLSGRAALPAGAGVTIEADRGAGFAEVATTTVQSDGSFHADVVPGSTATWRAVAGADASPPVTLLVLDRRVAIRAGGRPRRPRIEVTVTPPSPGGTVVLQLFLRERFGWWPVRSARLDRRSTARFALRLRRRVSARVLLTLPDRATPLAVSPARRVGPARGRHGQGR